MVKADPTEFFDVAEPNLPEGMDRSSWDVGMLLYFNFIALQ